MRALGGRRAFPGAGRAPLAPSPPPRLFGPGHWAQPFSGAPTLPLLPWTPTPQGSAVGFLLQLDNGAKLQAHVFLVYADAQPCSPGAGATGAMAAGGEERGEHFAW